LKYDQEEDGMSKIVLKQEDRFDSFKNAFDEIQTLKQEKGIETVCCYYYPLSTNNSHLGWIKSFSIHD
jgi:hypothetical protein